MPGPACRGGDTLVVAKLDRQARSLRDAKDIIDELTAKDVKLSIGGSVHYLKDPVGRLPFQGARNGRRVRVRSDPG
ncbi:recombinase family protein [Cryobacterium sp. SO1]|uniref:recombinase family protein n=1 Tax=Cryobacterium sp. SO1 TaxID=1897061 RepID=UPI00351F2A37